MCMDQLKKFGGAAESSDDEMEEGEEEVGKSLSMSDRRMNTGNFRRTIERAENDLSFLKEHGYISVQKHRKKKVPVYIGVCTLYFPTEQPEVPCV